MLYSLKLIYYLKSQLLKSSLICLEKQHQNQNMAENKTDNLIQQMLKVTLLY